MFELMKTLKKSKHKKLHEHLDNFYVEKTAANLLMKASHNAAIDKCISLLKERRKKSRSINIKDLEKLKLKI